MHAAEATAPLATLAVVAATQLHHVLHVALLPCLA
jgi:hypothetical protein